MLRRKFLLPTLKLSPIMADNTSMISFACLSIAVLALGIAFVECLRQRKG